MMRLTSKMSALKLNVNQKKEMKQAKRGKQLGEHLLTVNFHQINSNRLINLGSINRLITQTVIAYQKMNLTWKVITALWLKRYQSWKNARALNRKNSQKYFRKRKVIKISLRHLIEVKLFNLKTQVQIGKTKPYDLMRNSRILKKQKKKCHRMKSCWQNQMRCQKRSHNKTRIKKQAQKINSNKMIMKSLKRRMKSKNLNYLHRNLAQ